MWPSNATFLWKDKNTLLIFKKCLVRLFAKQEKDVFLETVIGLSKQHRQCLIECIPIPSHLLNTAPIYFKKAIDEADDDWAQHDAKKLIPTTGNLCQVIPANVTYFHVEFGLDHGFVPTLSMTRLTSVVVLASRV